MMAYNRPAHDDPFYTRRQFNDQAQQQQQQGLRLPPGLPSSLPLHQTPHIGQVPQQQHPQPMNAASLAAAAAGAASPGSLESRLMMRRLMIRRAAQQAQDMQSLHNALMAEANAKAMQQQLHQQQQQQHNSFMRQGPAYMDPYQHSPVPGLDLLRSVSQYAQQQNQQRTQLGLPSIGQLDHASFLSPSPNQPPARLAAVDFSMLPRAPFSRDVSVTMQKDPMSPSNNTIYSPSPAADAPRNTIKLFVDDIQEWDVLCGRGGRSNRKLIVNSQHECGHVLQKSVASVNMLTSTVIGNRPLW
ncbi:hypothetical protein MPSEU_000901700 [Mayamaea pseudoterrestris]|nr:hypothetical protein MPSEU_000901700 [Mayamaea pseudoterrestris]